LRADACRPWCVAQHRCQPAAARRSPSSAIAADRQRHIALTRSADGWSIVSSGRIGAPLDTIARRVEVRYTPDWRPRDMTIDATVRGQAQSLHTVIDGTNAKRFTTNGQPTQKTDSDRPARSFSCPARSSRPTKRSPSG
jgi:hypothetical protein